jgi:serine/threonine protein phosphatase 1
MKSAAENLQTGRPTALSRFLRAAGFAKPEPARVPENCRIYAIGDIHGCLDLLNMLHASIVEDARSFAGEKHVVYLGDFVDRGNDSKGVIDVVLDHSPAGFAAHYIKGNHDAALLAFLDDPETYRVWRNFGGADTLLSYGVRPPLYDSLEQFTAARDLLRVALPAAHLAFFRSLELVVTIGDYAFVHAGVRPGIPLARQSEYDLLWIRDEFLGSSAAHEKTIVHGHTPLPGPVRTANRISVDTGAYATGVLTSAVLEGTQCRFLQAKMHKG